MINITDHILAEIFPTTSKDILASFVKPLNDTFEKYDISTLARASCFIAQVGHESAGLTALKENLNYSASGLRRIFGKYFPTDALAAQYARNPEKIANKVYANRGGNGDEHSGDGWAFRGKGLIQITFRDTTTLFGKAVDMSVTDALAYLMTPEGAAISAGWFWSTHGLNALADQGNFLKITRRINGGNTGEAEREVLLARAKKYLT